MSNELKEYDSSRANEYKIPTLISPVIKKFLLIYAVILGVFVYWMFNAQLYSGSIAMGFIVAEGGNKIISHNENGFIDKIFVKEGDFVEKGSVIIALDSTENRTNLNILMTQKNELEAMIGRIRAEEVGKNFDMDGLDEAAYQKEFEIWKAKKELIKKEELLAKEKIEQVDFEIDGYKRDEKTSLAVLENTKQELYSSKNLYKERFIDKTKVLSLESRVAELEGKIEIARVNQYRLEGKKRELLEGVEKLKKDIFYQNSKDFRRATDDLKSVNFRIQQENIRISRKNIVAPVSGNINKLYYKTVGAVISGSYPIAEIVPSNTRLLAEVKVNPDDIRFIHEGTFCYLRFPAYKTRYFNPVNGKIIWLSADAVKEASGNSYYLARIELDQQSLKKENITMLESGMRVQAEMRLEERSVARYLFDPIRMSLIHAFKEI